ncbi:hypothetical protein I302_103938 [Kwoniella bestiolae CBS 10118]|uniref:Uncharacterized protein n=1 Tax=Kwoniella bestiolae CBS 10118 TaxID=1296100 RepID=A0A1B9G9T1_9TREE|nr:hypothetical protein I302_02644 [Kwoniella bestiolae CBS 10118]OCF27795.1 hypothetical protein I302_02644 [Kwoniella bestiolae CBS 10118]
MPRTSYFAPYKLFADLLNIPQPTSKEENSIPLDFHSSTINSFLDWLSISKTASHNFGLSFEGSKALLDFAEHILSDELKELMGDQLIRSAGGNSDKLLALACEKNHLYMAKSALRNWRPMSPNRFPQGQSEHGRVAHLGRSIEQLSDEWNTELLTLILYHTSTTKKNLVLGKKDWESIIDTFDPGQRRQEDSVREDKKYLNKRGHNHSCDCGCNKYNKESKHYFEYGREEEDSRYLYEDY